MYINRRQCALVFVSDLLLTMTYPAGISNGMYYYFMHDHTIQWIMVVAEPKTRQEFRVRLLI